MVSWCELRSTALFFKAELLLIPWRWRQYVPLKHVSPSYNPTHSEITAVKFRSESVVRPVLQKEVGYGQIWLVCVCAGTYWYGFVTCWRKCWHWGTVEHEAGLWRCDVMLPIGQRVVLVHVEVRCYATYWTAGGVRACGGAMLCYVVNSGWC
jgi:hypothetical protein